MYKFYLTYYREIHHILSLIIFWFIFLVGGIDLLSTDNFILAIFVILINYPVANWCIKKSGLEETCETEKKNLKK